MAAHPYISGPGNIAQMIAFLKKNFPPAVTSETVKKLGLASKNESYVINVLHFLGLIDEQGKRTEEGHTVMTRHDEKDFQTSFETLVKRAYTDLFELHGDDAWDLNKDQLIGYFRNADKTSEVIGGRQAGVFSVLRELAGRSTPETAAPKLRAANGGKPKSSRKPKPAALDKPEVVRQDSSTKVAADQKGEIALTVRVEINLPAEGTQETYDAIFKSIKANLYP